jgi:two-component system, NtrC family, nitrogen regulation response regulator GlnG
MSERGSTEKLEGDPSPPMSLKLVVVAGPDFGKELELGPGRHRIGSGPSNEWSLTDTAMSASHLEVECLPEGLRLVDLKSTNGSFCDGVRFREAEAKPGALIRLGRTCIRVRPSGPGVPLIAPWPDSHYEGLVGQSLRMREAFALLEKAAHGQGTVLIRGETGTGKELAARAVHHRSKRAQGPYEVLDLGSVSADLFEAELFGHVKGAFTHAQSDRVGAFERADTGVLFLDEIGELPLELQSRLLRVLERGEVRRVGGTSERKVDVRVVAATHRNLEELVAQGKFREDLYHRIAVVELWLPPLRERSEDVPLLLNHVLERLGKGPDVLGAETRALLREYAWPGNVRQLFNVVQRATVMGEQALFPGVVTASSPATFKEARDQVLLRFERLYLEELLNRHGWNVSRAAGEAAVTREYLHKLVRRHGLTRPGGVTE